MPLFGRKRDDQAPDDDGTAGLRKLVLSTTAEDMGLGGGDDDRVYGVLMETGYPGATATVVSLADGTTSLYFSNGGGTIGAGEHEPVAETTRAFVAMAQTFISDTEPTSDFPMPEVGNVRFQLLTVAGGRTANAPAEELGEERHPLSPLFYAGQDVITQIRLLSESQQR